MKKITLSKLIASTRPTTAMILLQTYGVPKAKSLEMLEWQLDKMILRQGEPFLKELAEIHPHRDLIIAQYKDSLDQANISAPEVKKVVEEVSNCGGCKFSSVNGEEKTKQTELTASDIEKNFEKYHNATAVKVILFGTVAMILGAAILKEN